MYNLGEMKRLLAYLFLVLGLGLVFSVNTNASVELLKSAIKINKKEKVIYLLYGESDYSSWTFRSWDFLPLKINDLRGDGIVYYIFDDDRYYRVSEDYKVVSTGNFKYKKEFYKDNKENAFC